MTASANFAMIRRVLHAPLTWAVVALCALAAAFGLYWFQPWKLLAQHEVSDPLSDPLSDPVLTSIG